MAASKVIIYGCMVSGAMLRSSPDFSAAVAREAAMTVPSDEMKWAPTQPRPGPANYQEPDKIWRFALEQGPALRGPRRG
jgi:GH35 family endo-1,4-beta-xylanase